MTIVATANERHEAMALRDYLAQEAGIIGPYVQAGVSVWHVVVADMDAPTARYVLRLQSVPPTTGRTT